MDEITQRVTRAAESILENEGLTAGLEDETAQALLDWALACAKLVARSTAAMDEAAAKEAMYPRLRATRHLMRQVRRWRTNLDEAAEAAAQQRLGITQRFRRMMGRQKSSVEDDKAATELLTGVTAQAAIIYGKDYNPPSSTKSQAFLTWYAEMSSQPLQVIARLRELVEPTIHD